MEVNVWVLSIVLFFLCVILCVVCVCLVRTLLLRLNFPKEGGCKREERAGGFEIPLRLGMSVVASLSLGRVV